MGTNYYLTATVCPCCKQPTAENKHIGKSSAGWVFALHVYPEEGINDLPDWKEKWSADGATITDEYGKIITPAEMFDVVMARYGARDRKDQDDSWYACNGAERGPYRLARAKIGRHCIAHGLGTYSCHTGDFS